MSEAISTAGSPTRKSLKPGNHMPTVGLEPEQLHAVVAYLETLK